VFLLEKLNDTFRSPTDLEGKTGLTVLAAIPSIGKRKRPKQMVSSLLRKPNSALAESIRNMRTSILFSNLDQPPKVVMFTSSVPKEAKTTTSMLMAIASQQMGHSAIIVDCDLRRRTLSSIFPTNPDQPGLLAVLEGSSSIDDAVFEEPETGLHVLGPEPAGRGQGNPADILASQRFRRLIEELRSRYDLVILDTPPVLVVTDSRIVAQLADAVVYIVRWDNTNRGAVIEGLRELTSIKARIAGLALTMVDEARAAKFVDNEFYYKRKYKKYITS
jgi:succinoglycan biosynthesis transport protein ExoP